MAKTSGDEVPLRGQEGFRSRRMARQMDDPVEAPGGEALTVLEDKVGLCSGGLRSAPLPFPWKSPMIPSSPSRRVPLPVRLGALPVSRAGASAAWIAMGTFRRTRGVRIAHAVDVGMRQHDELSRTRNAARRGQGGRQARPLRGHAGIREDEALPDLYVGRR